MIKFFSKMMARKKSEEDGFTLIELIVVIAIIGILAAIAVPRLSDFTGQARTAANQATARSILSTATALEAEIGAGLDTVNGETTIDGTPIADAAAWISVLDGRIQSVTVAGTADNTTDPLTWGISNDGTGYTITAPDSTVMIQP